eukprot:3826117-Pyramimonas_sp.AAC.1
MVPFSSWELVFARLPARDLSRVAPTCSVFAHVVRALHLQREEDVSGGLEKMKIPHIGRWTVRPVLVGSTTT